MRTAVESWLYVAFSDILQLMNSATAVTSDVSVIRLTMEIGMSDQSISSGSCMLAEIIQQHESSKTCFVAVTCRVDAHLGRRICILEHAHC